MGNAAENQRYRFGVFEADVATGELRRQGIRIKLNAQPFQVLAMFLERPGELLSREDIARGLWPDGTFVDYEHGVNTAVNRIREALGDTAANPRFVETLARRGYRFVAPVDKLGAASAPSELATGAEPELPLAEPNPSDPAPRFTVLATPEELPKTSHQVVKTLFLLLQAMYLAFYIGALANLAEITDLFSAIVPRPFQALLVLIVTAATLIPVRAFVMTGVLFRAPRMREKFLKMWPYLLAADELWSLSPFLLLHHMNFGMALSCTALLVYSPFAQRALMLMGVAGADTSIRVHAA